ncbi:MAG: tetratricopeptide repeat protein [Candidatus Krumholzibacteriota bacterium]
MKKQEFNTPRDRKMKFAEAGVMFVLVMALTIFIGVRVVDQGDNDELVTEPVVANEVIATEAEQTGLEESTITVEAEHPDEVAAEPAAVVAETPEPRIVTYAEAEKAYFARKYDEAADMFSIYTDEHPANAWGFYMQGLSEWKAGDNDAAAEAFAYALEIKPDHVKSLINYGRVLLEQGRQDEAKTQIELALAANPESTVATRVLGRIQNNQGLLEEAAASYLTVLRAKEDDAWSLNNLGLIRIQQGRYDEALPALAKAVQIEPAVACFQNNLGVALERTGHVTAAGEAYTAALEADEGYEKADISLARVSELTEAEDLMPVDLAVLADSFSAANDMEVAAADQATEVEFPVEEEPVPARDDDDTPEN